MWSGKKLKFIWVLGNERSAPLSIFTVLINISLQFEPIISVYRCQKHLKITTVLRGPLNDKWRNFMKAQKQLERYRKLKRKHIYVLIMLKCRKISYCIRSEEELSFFFFGKLKNTVILYIMGLSRTLARVLFILF